MNEAELYAYEILCHHDPRPTAQDRARATLIGVRRTARRQDRRHRLAARVRAVADRIDA